MRWIAWRTACAFTFCMIVGCRLQTDRQTEKQSKELSVDIETARAHEIAPVRHLLHADDLKDGFQQLQLDLKVSRTGEVVEVKASSPDEAMKYWPRLESEVRHWKFKPFEADGRAVEAELNDYINIVPAEKLPKVHVKPPALLPDSKIQITLERTACMGSCPAYKVEISPNGVVFDGYYFVAAPGRHALGIDPAQVRALAQRFVDGDFYSMEPKYEYGVTDNPTFTLSIDIDGHRKQVMDYVGDEMGMPEVISDLEDAVDRLAGTDRWIQGDGLMATLHAEQFDFYSFQAQVIAKQAAMRGQTGLMRDLLAAGVPIAPQKEPSLGSSSPTSYLFEQMVKIGWLDSAFVHPDALQLLMDRGVSRGDQHDKDVALAGAAQRGDIGTVKKLTAYGANPNANLSGGKILFGTGLEGFEQEGAGSILYYAATSGKPEMVREILRYRPNLDARDGFGRTALFVVGEDRYREDVNMLECMELLIAAGVNVNAQDEEGKTALHRTSDAAQAEILLKHGANPNIRDKDGETPLFEAWNDGMMKVLLAHGADPGIRNRRGKTALQTLKADYPNQAQTLQRWIAQEEQNSAGAGRHQGGRQ